MDLILVEEYLPKDITQNIIAGYLLPTVFDPDMKEHVIKRLQLNHHFRHIYPEWKKHIDEGDYGFLYHTMKQYFNVLKFRGTLEYSFYCNTFDHMIFESRYIYFKEFVKPASIVDSQEKKEG